MRDTYHTDSPWLIFVVPFMHVVRYVPLSLHVVPPGQQVCPFGQQTAPSYGQQPRPFEE